MTLPSNNTVIVRWRIIEKYLIFMYININILISIESLYFHIMHETSILVTMGLRSCRRMN
jgi:hypothetical protein